MTGVSLDAETLGLDLGSSAATLVATVTPTNATNQNVTWSSSEPSVATVTQDGEVSPVGEGTTTISVTTADGGFTATSTVTVYQTVAWVMSYFGSAKDLSADSLHLAHSQDGLNWRTLNEGGPVYQLSDIGKNQIRDPFILRKRDGTFAYIATDWTRDDNVGYWSNPSPNIVVVDSADLITFTDARLLRVTNHSGPLGTDMHAWAPEAHWDAVQEEYAILWSGNDSTGINRIYVTYTTDFHTVRNLAAEVFFDPGYNVIDATLVPTSDRYYLFFKDETDDSGSSVTGSGKDIQVARSSGPDPTPGTFKRWQADYITRGTEQSTKQQTEGPFVVKLPDENRWCMCADFYQHKDVVSCWTTTDLDVDPSEWNRLSSDKFNMPPGMGHANAVRVTQAELNALLDHYGSSSLLRSTASNCNGQSCYFAHSWLHGILTHLSDRTDTQTGNDFYWNLVPGLANPDDPDLVSFQAVSQPGHYAHIDSENTARYPDCETGANRSEGLCDVLAEDQNHLVWVDEYEDSDTYRADATFRIVEALNGDTSMVSIQWYRDSTRFLRPAAFQVFARTVSTAQEQIDSSFTIE